MSIVAGATAVVIAAFAVGGVVTDESPARDSSTSSGAAPVLTEPGGPASAVYDPFAFSGKAADPSPTPETPPVSVIDTVSQPAELLHAAASPRRPSVPHRAASPTQAPETPGATPNPTPETTARPPATESTSAAPMATPAAETIVPFVPEEDTPSPEPAASDEPTPSADPTPSEPAPESTPNVPMPPEDSEPTSSAEPAPEPSEPDDSVGTEAPRTPDDQGEDDKDDSDQGETPSHCVSGAAGYCQ